MRNKQLLTELLGESTNLLIRHSLSDMLSHSPHPEAEHWTGRERVWSWLRCGGEETRDKDVASTAGRGSLSEGSRARVSLRECGVWALLLLATFRLQQY